MHLLQEGQIFSGAAFQTIACDWRCLRAEMAVNRLDWAAHDAKKPEFLASQFEPWAATVASADSNIQE
jgi:hypothetical protein